MASNYSSIRGENERRYGTDIGRIGKMLLANLYADRTHFIYELLQNAEDAMVRRGKWQGSRAVRFTLSKLGLRVSHFGEPFNEGNVRAICNIAETTKDLIDIGRFGIGFKSVYAFTDLPEVHSGEESFAIENYVWPAPVRPIDQQADETVFLLPLRPQDATALDEITDGLRKLGAQTLLFLRQIDEIAWSVEGGPSGLYLRGEPVTLGENVRRITVIGQQQGRPDIEDTWLVFSRSTKTDSGSLTTQVEIALSITQDKESRRQSVQAVNESPLVVFFPTVLQTHLGFLVQGPYRTTPSRDNVPRNDPWNQHLVKETAALLVEVLRSLRDLGLLDVGALSSLPLDRTRFGEGQMFATLFNAVQEALSTEGLLPCFGGGHASAKRVKLARTQELRELVSAAQLGALFGEAMETFWLSEDITQDRTPELRQYLMRDLDIAEVTPESVLPKLGKTFLQTQPDEWICRLYEFLNGQPSLRWRLSDLPLIRLEDGTHIASHSNGHPQVFLPSEITSSFPTVRRAVCAIEEARKFLQSLGLTEPDPVDDVVRNVLPKYRAEDTGVADSDYEADISRILTAFGTDSKTQREKLLAALRDSFFVKAVDGGSGAKRWASPGTVYLATDRLKELFAGVTGVLLVDDSYACLKGEDVRDLLEACGAVRHLRAVPDNSLTSEERKDLRKQAGHEETSYQKDRIEDWMLVGIDGLLTILPQFDSDDRRKKANLLWDELAHLEERRGKSVFGGVYTWTHYGQYKKEFPSAFVRQLNETAWVPDGNGELQRPEFVIFDTLGWKPNPFLLSKIRFKPPIIETLAREAGIEPGVLDLLKKLGVTSEAEFKRRFGIKEEPQPPEGGVAPPVGEPVVDPPQITDGLVTEKPTGPTEAGTPPPAKPDSGTPEHTTTAPKEREPLQLKDPETAEYVVMTEMPSGGDGSVGRGGGRAGGGGGGGAGGGAGGGGGSAGTVPLSEEEKHAIDMCGRLLAQRELEKRGYVVEQMPAENPGFDLKATKDGEELRVEVKAHLGRATVVDDLTKRQYDEYQISRTGGAGYKWQLWNIENLKDKAIIIIAPYREIPDEALEVKMFRVDLKKCVLAE